jgi:hypothetical protein
MAIKGKRRTRHRTTRAPARVAPRPFLVRPKPPLFQRTGTKVVLVVLAETVVFLLLAFAGLQTQADQRRERISEFTTLVQAQLYQSGAAQQSFTGPLILPELGQAVAGMGAGQVPDLKELTRNARGWEDVARQAGDNIGRIEAEGLALVEARNLMQQGLLMFSAVANQIQVAAELEGAQQAELVEGINDQMNLAATVFDTGWGKLQEERRQAGLETQSVLPGDLGGMPGGIPGVTGPGGGPTEPAP